MPEVLDLDVRRRIHAFVSESPGLHLREIQRRLGIALGTLRYHLRVLEDESFILAMRERNRKRYFATGMSPEERSAVAVLRAPGPRAVASYLLGHPGATIAELADATGRSKTSTRTYVELLRGGGLLAPQRDTERGRYFLANSPWVADLLRTYGRSFADDVVERALEIFERSRWPP